MFARNFSVSVNIVKKISVSLCYQPMQDEQNTRWKCRTCKWSKRTCCCQTSCRPSMWKGKRFKWLLGHFGLFRKFRKFRQFCWSPVWKVKIIVNFKIFTQFVTLLGQLLLRARRALSKITFMFRRVAEAQFLCLQTRPLYYKLLTTFSVKLQKRAKENLSHQKWASFRDSEFQYFIGRQKAKLTRSHLKNNRKIQNQNNEYKFWHYFKLNLFVCWHLNWIK